MSKNILLVYPEFPSTTYWSFTYALDFLGKKAATPPLGLITIAPMFPEDYNIRLIDMNIQGLSDDDIRWADGVFTSTMIIQQKSLKEVILRSNALNKPVIAGGPYPTTSSDKIKGVSHFILGEAENTLGQFIRDFERGIAKPVYSNPNKPELGSTLIPRFDLLDMEKYGSMAIQYSRGCPFQCEFCDIWGMYGNKPRLKGPEKFIAELNRLLELGWKGPLFVVDDNFIGNKSAVKTSLLPEIIRWQKKHKYPFGLYTEASVNLADDEELMELMRDAGFDMVFVGIETPAEESLQESNKRQNVKKNLLESVRRIQAYGMEVTAGFIVGFDNDPIDIFQRQIDFIQDAGIPIAMVGMLSALRGTNLYDRLQKEGRLIKDSDGNNTHSFEPNFIPKMDIKTLREGYKHILNTIYDPTLRNYFQRCITFFNNIRKNAQFSRGIGIKEIIALIRFIVIQPFEEYGEEYLKFLAKTLVKYPTKFPEAVRLAMMGHHLRTITQEALKVDKLHSYMSEKESFFSEQFDYITRHLSRSPALSEANVSRQAAERLKDLFVHRNEMLTYMGKKIKSLHKDFKEDVNQRYVDLRKKLNSMFKHWPILNE